MLSATISCVAFVLILFIYTYRKRHAIRKIAVESLEDMELIERRKEIDEKLNVIKQKKQNKISRFLEIQQEHERKIEKDKIHENKIHHPQGNNKSKAKVIKVRDVAKAQGKEVFKSSHPNKKKRNKIVPTIGENDLYNSAEGED